MTALTSKTREHSFGIADLVLHGPVRRVDALLHYHRDNDNELPEFERQRAQVMARNAFVDVVRRSSLGLWSTVAALVATTITTRRLSRRWPLAAMPLVLAYRSSWWVRGLPWPRIDPARKRNALIRRRDPHAPALHFYPHAVSPETVIWKIADELGLPIVRSRRPGVLNFLWHVGTKSSEGTTAAIETTGGAPINAACTDTSKTTVDRIWGEVSGRALGIDPTATRGPLVVKSDANGRNDGRIVNGPLRTRSKGRVYQRLIDTHLEAEMVKLRTVVIRRRVVMVIEARWNPPPGRFSGHTMCARLLEPAEAFSASELEEIHLFVDRLGMDYGELDILRDSRDGQTYVVDANRTPTGPTPALLGEERHTAIRRQAAIFAELIRDRLPDSTMSRSEEQEPSQPG